MPCATKSDARHDDLIDATATRISAVGGPSELVLIQAKRTRHIVSAKTVSEFADAVRQRGAPRGVLVTTSGVSDEARELAGSIGNIDLVDGRELRITIRRYLGRETPEPQKDVLF
jgi:restriction endonuclease Mrr